MAPGVLLELAHELSQLADERADDAVVLHIESHIFELCHAAREWRDMSWLDAVRSRLREEYRQPFALGDLARSAHRHPSHLVRAFRRRWGMTPGDYLRRVRVAAAIRLLRESNEPASIIALKTGFADQSHMGRCMRRFAGQTPGEVRAGRKPPL
jgi:AraC family transcriptional regulator